MALLQHSGVISTPTSVGDQVITGLGFSPKVVLFFGQSPTTSELNNVVSAASQALGAAGGAGASDQWAFHTRMSGSVRDRAYRAGRCFATSASGAGAALIQAAMKDLGADGFTLTYSNVDTGNSRKLYYIALGGTELQSKVGVFTTPSADLAQFSVTGVGFSPRALLTASSPHGNATQTTGGAFAVGFCTGIGTGVGGDNVAMGANSSTSVGRVFRDDAAHVRPNGNDAFGAAQVKVTSMDPDGFTCIVDFGVTATIVTGYVALGNVNVKAGYRVFNGASPSQSVTGVGFKPSVGIFMGTQLAAANSTATVFDFGLGIATAELQAAMSARTVDATTSSAAYRVQREGSIYVAQSAAANTVAYQMALSSFDNDGFTTAATGDAGVDRAVGYLLLATDPSAGTPTPPADSISLQTGPADRRVYQRGHAPFAQVGGTFSGTVPDDVQFRLLLEGTSTVARDWQSVPSLTIGASSWSGSFSVPVGGYYTMELRSVKGGAVLATATPSNRFACGDVFGVIGSSTAEKIFTDGTGVATASAAKMQESGNTNTDVWLPVGTIGSFATELARLYVATFGVPVGFLDYGISGTRLDQWIAAGYAGWTDFSRAINGAGGKLAGIVCHVGSNDAAAGSGSAGVASQAQHEADLRTLFQMCRSATGQADLPVFFMGCNRRQESSQHEAFTWIRAAELAVGGDANVYVTTAADLPMAADATHLSLEGMRVSGRRVAQAMRCHFGTELYYQGPRITGAKRRGAKVQVYVEQRGGQALVSASSPTGFDVLVNGAAATVSSAAIVDSKVELVLAAAPLDSDTVVVRYQYGTSYDTASPVYDDFVIEGGTGGLPLIPMGFGVTAQLTGGGRGTPPHMAQFLLARPEK